MPLRAGAAGERAETAKVVRWRWWLDWDNGSLSSLELVLVNQLIFKQFFQDLPSVIWLNVIWLKAVARCLVFSPVYRVTVSHPAWHVAFKFVDIDVASFLQNLFGQENSAAGSAIDDDFPGFVLGKLAKPYGQF